MVSYSSYFIGFFLIMQLLTILFTFAAICCTNVNSRSCSAKGSELPMVFVISGGLEFNKHIPRKMM